MGPTLDDILLSLTIHTPTQETKDKVERVTAATKTLATTIFRECPPSPQRTKALGALEEQAFWAIKSITQLRQPRLGD